MGIIEEQVEIVKVGSYITNKTIFIYSYIPSRVFLLFLNIILSID